MKVVDLFCGAGGLSKGFEMAGFEVILGIDHFEPAIDTFRKNHPKAVSLKEDIRTVDSEKIKSLIGNQRVDVIVGGPPVRASVWLEKGILTTLEMHYSRSSSGSSIS